MSFFGTKQNKSLGVFAVAAVAAAAYEADVLIANMDNTEMALESADNQLERLGSSIELDNAILGGASGGPTLAVAQLAVEAFEDSKVALGAGSSDVIVVEESTDPARALAIVVEEKQGMIASIVTRIVALLRKMMNMAKKAMVKVILTVASTKKKTETLISDLEELAKQGKHTVDKGVIDDVMTSFPILTYTNDPVKDIADYFDYSQLLGKKEQDQILAIGKVDGEVSPADAINPISTKVNNTASNEVEKYLKDNKDAVFGSTKGDFETTVVCVGPSYAKALVLGGTAKVTTAKILKVKFEENPAYKAADTVLDITLMIKTAKALLKDNESIKSDSDASFKLAGKAITAAEKLKKANSGDKVSTDVKLQLSLYGVASKRAFSSAIDRYRMCRAVTNALVKMVKEAKKVEK